MFECLHYEHELLSRKCRSDMSELSLISIEWMRMDPGRARRARTLEAVASLAVGTFHYTNAYCYAFMEFSMYILTFFG